MAMHMSNEDLISAFLKTIPKYCKNRELAIEMGIIKGDRSRLPTLIGNVIPHLLLSMDMKEHGDMIAQHTIANMNMGLHPSLTPQNPGKWQQCER